MIQPERIRLLNKRIEASGKYILYWMQASQRAAWNHALEYAIEEANRRRQPVVAVFGITDRFPEANVRHYTFMLEGLKETQSALIKRGIQLVVQHRSPEKAALVLARDASMVVTDCGYLKIQRVWRETVAEDAPCPVIQVETDVIVPVRQAYGKEAYSAGILRPKIEPQLKKYLVALQEKAVKKDSLGLRFDCFTITDVPKALKALQIDETVPPVSGLRGGTNEAIAHLERFQRERLKRYHKHRNDPGLDLGSNMSPYLHFGQISPLFIALKILQKRRRSDTATGAFLEELVVRRELSMNFVHYNDSYDTMGCLPEWARNTLKNHEKDKREFLYSDRQWEEARTHDPYWNAAQKEMVLTGKMHNYMRMYWGKKILEWTARPEKAYRLALYLNNKYEIDGRDPNGFAGVAWCFGKHDRAWKERPVFGKVRYMNAAGLRRKFDMDRYLERIERLKEV